MFAPWVPGRTAGRCWAAVTRTPRSFSCWAAPQPLSSHLCLWLALCCPRCCMWHLPLLNFVNNLSRPSSLQAVKNTFHSVSTSDLLRMHSTPASRSLINTLNRTGSRVNPWGTLMVLSARCSSMDYNPMDYNPLSSAIELIHNAASSVCLFMSQLDSLSRKVLRGVVSRALLKSRKITSADFPLYTKWVT